MLFPALGIQQEVDRVEGDVEALFVACDLVLEKFYLFMNVGSVGYNAAKSGKDNCYLNTYLNCPLTI